MTMHVDRLDHLVLTVRDVEATCAFYVHALGMRVVTFGDGRKALAFGSQKINLHQHGPRVRAQGATADARLGGLLPHHPGAAA